MRLIEQFEAFDILAHIDYPIRSWAADAKPYDPHDFEDEYRHVLRCLATADKTLEVNTRAAHCTARCWRGGASRAARPSPSPVTPTTLAHSPEASATP